MSDNFTPRGKKSAASIKAALRKSKYTYGTKKQAYATSENGKKPAYTVRVSDSHKGPQMHIGVNPPTSDPPPPSPGKKELNVPKVVVVPKTVRGKNTTKAVKGSMCSKAARKLGQSYHIKDRPGGTWRKK